MKDVRASLIELYTRFTPLKKEKEYEYYLNGGNNEYPNEIERVVNNSPTAKKSVDILASYIAGSEVVNGEIIVNSKGQTLTEIVLLASKNIAKQGGCYFHVGYGINDLGEIKPKKLTVLNYTNCRKSKEDSDANFGKIILQDFLEKDVKKQKKQWFYPFNSNKNVVLSQIKKDSKKETLEEAIKTFRGQVFYLNLTPEYQYALSYLDSVYNDCDTEYRMSLYSNTQTREGFLGKLIVLTQGLDNETREQIEKDVSLFLGAENSGSAYLLNAGQTENLDNVLKVVQVQPQINDNLFTNLEKRIRKNILGACNNIPEALVSSSDGALFGTNSETYKQMKLFYSEQTKKERLTLQNTLIKLGFECEIKPVVDENVKVETDAQSIAQAQLKGTASGVIALIQLQQSVSQGITDRASAVVIIQEIYGIGKEIAELMIGTPIVTQPNESTI